jgi:carbonic anhydrase
MISRSDRERRHAFAIFFFYIDYVDYMPKWRRMHEHLRPSVTTSMIRIGTIERRAKRGETMSQILSEVLAANSTYVEKFGDKGALALPPARRFAILTCMDARLDPAKYAGLSEGDAHVIRNAGGRATDDAIRSLVISHKLLGTLEWFVIHHSNCGMELFTDDVIANLLDDDLGTAKFDGKKWSNPHHGGGHAAGHFIKWQTIGDQAASVLQDVRRIREHPLVPSGIPIYGYIYDVHSGRLDEVKEATAAGRGSKKGIAAGA